MRILIAAALLGLLTGTAGAQLPPGEPSAVPGDFFARLRANDAPVGGRLTLYAYFLDSLDVALPRPVAGDTPPAEGRWLYLLFREASEGNTFVIPGDLSLEDRSGRRYRLGFHPLGEGRFEGDLHPGEERAALWWVPFEADVADDDLFRWAGVDELRLWYGPHNRTFLPLDDEEDRAKVHARVRWDEAMATRGDPLRRTDTVDWTPNPTAFDTPPEVKEFIPPEYPLEARQYNLTGVVHVVAQVDERGVVGHVFVARSNAGHLLNVSALGGVKDWTFRPGRKNGVKTAGEIVVPISFAEERNR